MGGHEENCQNSLAKHREREQGRTCSAARRTRVQINEAGISLFVDKDRVPWAFPWTKFARKPCTSKCKRSIASSLTFGRGFTPADVASKRRRLKSQGCHPHNQGERFFGEPSRPKPVFTQGQGRGPQRGRVPGEHSNRRLHPPCQEDQGQACPLSRCA